MPEPPEPNIYQLKVVLLGISPIIWRRVRTENCILAMKSPFSDDAAPISSSN